MKRNVRIVVSPRFYKFLLFNKAFMNPTQKLCKNSNIHRVRLSDGVVFIDCSLVGPYCIKDNKIVSIDSGQSQI